MRSPEAPKMTMMQGSGVRSGGEGGRGAEGFAAMLAILSPQVGTGDFEKPELRPFTIIELIRWAGALCRIRKIR